MSPTPLTHCPEHVHLGRPLSSYVPSPLHTFYLGKGCIEGVLCDRRLAVQAPAYVVAAGV
eukprot:364808-Chlamydomonas_euryale.AAC.3